MIKAKNTLTPRPPAKRIRRPFGLGGAIYLSVTLIAAGVLLRLFVLRDAIEIPWALQLIIAALTLAIGYLANRQWHHWTTSERQLGGLIPLIRKGEAAIDELNAVDGALHALIPHLQEVFRDIRLLKAQIGQMETEMSQKVARRTDALERTLGSLRRKASRDALTGLYNRRTLDEMLPQVFNQSRTNGGLLCLLMVDVDDFKLLNDTLGHAAGDMLLRDLGQLIRSSIREVDMGFRYGGDEFVIALPGCVRRDGETLCTRLISLTDGLTKPLRVPRPPRLSIGVIALDEVMPQLGDDPSATGLLRLADEVLYNNKVARKAARKAAASTSSRPSDQRAA